jgi:hypothetical protein
MIMLTRPSRLALANGWLVATLLAVIPQLAAAQEARPPEPAPASAADPATVPPAEPAPERATEPAAPPGQQEGPEKADERPDAVTDNFTAPNILSPFEQKRLNLLLSMTEEQRSEWLQRKFAREPTCAESQQAGLRNFRITPEDLDSQRRRLQNKGAVPVILLSQEFENTSSGRALDVNSSMRIPTHTTTESQRAHRTRTVGIFSMNMPHLVFNTSVLQSYGWTQIQHHVLKMVHAFFYLRRQYMTRLFITPPTEARAYASLALPISTHTGLLDNYTGGWFSRQLPENQQPTESPPAKSPPAP